MLLGPVLGSSRPSALIRRALPWTVPAPSLDVAIALQRYFPHGGVQRDALATALECRDRGHRVTLHVQRFDGATRRDRGPHPPGPWAHQPTRATRFAASWLEYDQPSAVTVGFDPLPGLDLHFGASRCYSAAFGRSAARGPA